MIGGLILNRGLNLWSSRSLILTHNITIWHALNWWYKWRYIGIWCILIYQYLSISIRDSRNITGILSSDDVYIYINQYNPDNAIWYTPQPAVQPQSCESLKRSSPQHFKAHRPQGERRAIFFSWWSSGKHQRLCSCIVISISIIIIVIISYIYWFLLLLLYIYNVRPPSYKLVYSYMKLQ